MKYPAVKLAADFFFLSVIWSLRHIVAATLKFWRKHQGYADAKLPVFTLRSYKFVLLDES